jgi:uncharacterized protein YjbI with pentapeptide repeats
MAGLADDWEQGRQTCIDVLCAFLRLPHTPEPGAALAESLDPAAFTAAQAAYLAAREVRHTVIRIIGNHLNGHTDVSWCGHDLDFTGAVFDGGDLHGAVFTDTANVSFQRASFVGGMVDFEGSRFEGGTVSFGDAKFEGGTVDLGSAWFGGAMVDFDGARFGGGTVSFRHASFMSGTVFFEGARFEGGTAYFGGARFEGGTVTFRGAGFEGGEVTFGGAVFGGGMVTFRQSAGRRPDGLPDDMATHLSQ